ncbi:MAG: tripartite tricarboxylate transporter TctB family protein [Gemmatimonadales bacterium]|nr:MAG: tripartite tricarboxylate transporter TctB family protein [Gemmatimonadales bacterium]
MQGPFPFHGSHPVNRVAGAGLLVLAAVAAWLARGYTVNFIADPVGPRAFPWVAAGLIAVGATFMLLRPEERAGPSLPSGRLRPFLLALVALGLYPVLLPLLGFITTTAGVMWVLARLFGGRAVPSAAASLGLAAAMYLLFVYLLSVPLPLGRLFLAGGGG